MSSPRIATITVYLRNGLSFRFHPVDPAFKPPQPHEIETLMRDDRAIQPVAGADPLVVLRWSEVVAVKVSDESADEIGGYA